MAGREQVAPALRPPEGRQFLPSPAFTGLGEREGGTSEGETGGARGRGLWGGAVAHIPRKDLCVHTLQAPALVLMAWLLGLAPQLLTPSKDLYPEMHKYTKSLQLL